MVIEVVAGVIYKDNKFLIAQRNLKKAQGEIYGKDYGDKKDLEAIDDIEDKIKYIGLGLRGRDIFDLELTSDVDNIKVLHDYKDVFSLERSRTTDPTTM